ncbi:GNAT family N-acetyltransferase [Halosegnis rubeus]|uniref:GNAT family N-acetyltransferase n=1 Tax=Halosegnis rubeus TaxID=2212850 RepID=A0A5N5UBA1_9EURY|nr:GNAT family N-acetyltransferase [Halosegnis rubeus]KAB7515916.1 GNAT family N-acetyltransferase [Halosegnis rubeus]KAB7516871.1 GNAT family N-acetyltransferase [Halosegnis rubeus]KAB7520002.1 GNAT family N-acetyltransferase [Halosegnis rubeus]
MIRPARPADKPAVRALQSLLNHRAPALLEAAFDAGAGDVVVATNEGSVVGYALAVPGDETVYLAELAVAPGVRREGYGRRLVASLSDDYDEFDQLRVTVAAGDDGARAFYTACGFWELDRIEDRFDGEDGLLLLRRLS